MMFIKLLITSDLQTVIIGSPWLHDMHIAYKGFQCLSRITAESNNINKKNSRRAKELIDFEFTMFFHRIRFIRLSSK